MNAIKESANKLFWISFARSGENYVVLEEAPTSRKAVDQAIPLKGFNPVEWSMECFQIPPDGPEAKDFEKHKLITEADLRAKGYLKPSELRQSN